MIHWNSLKKNINLKFEIIHGSEWCGFSLICNIFFCRWIINNLESMQIFSVLNHIHHVNENSILIMIITFKIYSVWMLFSKDECYWKCPVCLPLNDYPVTWILLFWDSVVVGSFFFLKSILLCIMGLKITVLVLHVWSLDCIGKQRHFL